MVDRFALPAALMGSKFLVPRSIENCTITDSSELYDGWSSFFNKGGCFRM